MASTTPRKKSQLYTRKGDKATTQLYGGVGRVSKDAAVFEALGTVDELSSSIGVARAALGGRAGARGLDACLATVQSVLLDVGSHVGVFPRCLGGCGTVRWGLT